MASLTAYGLIRHGESVIDAVLRSIWEKHLQERRNTASLEGRVFHAAV